MLLVKNTILIFVLAIFCSSLFGQRVVGKCSTVSTPEMDARLEANINYLEKNGAILTETPPVPDVGLTTVKRIGTYFVALSVRF